MSVSLEFWNTPPLKATVPRPWRAGQSAGRIGGCQSNAFVEGGGDDRNGDIVGRDRPRPRPAAGRRRDRADRTRGDAPSGTGSRSRWGPSDPGLGLDGGLAFVADPAADSDNPAMASNNRPMLVVGAVASDSISLTTAAAR